MLIFCLKKILNSSKMMTSLKNVLKNLIWNWSKVEVLDTKKLSKYYFILNQLLNHQQKRSVACAKHFFGCSSRTCFFIFLNSIPAVPSKTRFYFCSFLVFSRVFFCIRFFFGLNSFFTDKTILDDLFESTLKCFKISKNRFQNVFACFCNKKSRQANPNKTQSWSLSNFLGRSVLFFLKKIVEPSFSFEVFIFYCILPALNIQKSYPIAVPCVFGENTKNIWFLRICFAVMAEWFPQN